MNVGRNIKGGRDAFFVKFNRLSGRLRGDLFTRTEIFNFCGLAPLGLFVCGIKFIDYKGVGDLFIVGEIGGPIEDDAAVFPVRRPLSSTS